jgi:hypothetical protein
MSKLNDAMLERMAFIVFSENRPFSFRDFLQFRVDEKEYAMTHGTFRNKVYKLVKNGEVELSYYSSCAFYTLKGYKFGKLVTPDHTMVHNDPIYRMLENLPLERQSIHDIHLRFNIPEIWKRLSINPAFHINKRSQDISIPSWSKNNTIVRIIIHRTDVVTVIIGCSLQPILLDVNGIIRLFNLLVRIEEKLQTILDNSTPICFDKKCLSIPEYQSWIVTMWHFGRDASIEYTGEKFSITVNKLESILTRLYVKDFGNKKKIRLETQEYPKKTVVDAIEEKLGNNSNTDQYLGTVSKSQ